MRNSYVSEDLKELIEKCLENDRTSQYRFYEYYSTRVFGVCLRYAKNFADAEDILQEGFVKAFKYLQDYSGKGSMESWIRRIMVTTSLNYYKKKNMLNKDVDPENTNILINKDYEGLSDMSHEEILELIRELPYGYQTVFNLSTIEGYSHKEISEIMQISVNTSKSQLSRAKQVLRNKIESIFKLEENLLAIAALA
ncbi:MAG: RNA polymerase sigma factor [Lentimicrobiaceae bacterium]|jgi:RNA polymerase sigma-70 factor (ECF subfamily)|nr:RNA polymerase sigma factor [Lentimicrobiaceae bacterium]MCP4911251.1 RNA polymerase sigma factor [Bacteroidota bacterium]MBT3453961.1 RNA polymerase sigma factor [Lentimicrobiaceae bacterium]MBT3818572.1 RNA polymerase sigma factor [Lentimicrobiaceae bacterium]MBT4061932.1 RNA polymerase sigma factor [Lentimicrobiaceae bacterium]